MARDYLQEALRHFNTDKHQWYGWRENPTGDKVELYENLILLDSTATMPTETEVNNKITEIKNEESNLSTNRTNAINKLKGATYSALTDAEAKALFGI